MADALVARDEDRLPWLDSFEGDKKPAQRRKPVSRTALVGLLVLFFGVGVAIAFSLGYRFARPPAPTSAAQPQLTASDQVPLPNPLPQPRVELAGPTLGPETPAAAMPLAGAGADVPMPGTPEPTVQRPQTAKSKAPRRHARRKPILRPFKLTWRPAPEPARPVVVEPTPAPVEPASPAVEPARTAAAPAPALTRPAAAPVVAPPRPPALAPARQPALAPARPPVSRQRTIPFTPRGRIIQLGSYSTQRQADAAHRALVFRYPYLANKPKVISPTQPVGGWRYYRLRLGTQTQAQSAVICQYLQARGQSCIVIY